MSPSKANRDEGNAGDLPGFAERHGPTVLLAVGVALVLVGLACVFTGHQVVAGAMCTTGVMAIISAAVLSRMEGKFKVFFLSGNLARSPQRRGR